MKKLTSISKGILKGILKDDMRVAVSQHVMYRLQELLGNSNTNVKLLKKNVSTIEYRGFIMGKSKEEYAKIIGLGMNNYFIFVKKVVDVRGRL